MSKINPLVILAGFMATVFTVSTNCVYALDIQPDKLIAETDTIVVVEILSTDYSATAADGPMYAEARVLKVLKGNILRHRKLRFGENGWWNPTYQNGQRRIIFLNRTKAEDEYYNSKWQTTYTDNIDFFFAENSLDTLFLTSLSAFLKKIQAASGAQVKLELGLTNKDAKTKELLVKLINGSNKTFWLNPSHIDSSFEAHSVRHSCAIDWANYKKNTWIKIGPNSSINGVAYIAADKIKGTAEIKFMLSHLSTCFPYRCWTGIKAINLGFEN
jgi:hypothetical protein